MKDEGRKVRTAWLLALAVAWVSGGCSSDGDGEGDDGAGPNTGVSGTGAQRGGAGSASSNSGSGALPGGTWVASAWNPATDAVGLCAGDRVLCGAKSQAECQAMDVTAPEAGGWSKHVLPMAKYGPLIATEYGSFDCSSPFVTRLLGYADELGISYTTWALWPQNSGGPAGLGSCGYPALITPAADPGDFRACLYAGGCDALMQPLPWAGKATYDDIARH